MDMKQSKIRRVQPEGEGSEGSYSNMMGKSDSGAVKHTCFTWELWEGHGWIPEKAAKKGPWPVHQHGQGG